MLRLGSQTDRAAMRRAFAGRPPALIVYDDVLDDLEREGPDEVLMSLCYNPRLPRDVWQRLLTHPDVRVHANHLWCRLGMSRH
jgi:hypothetical protein